MFTITVCLEQFHCLPQNTAWSRSPSSALHHAPNLVALHWVTSNYFLSLYIDPQSGRFIDTVSHSKRSFLASVFWHTVFKAHLHWIMHRFFFFFFSAKYYSIVWTKHVVFPFSSSGGHVACCPFESRDQCCYKYLWAGGCCNASFQLFGVSAWEWDC